MRSSNSSVQSSSSAPVLDALNHAFNAMRARSISRSFLVCRTSLFCIVSDPRTFRAASLE